MLTSSEYQKAFLSIQEKIIPLTDELAAWVRIFINEQYRAHKLCGLLSIEPQVGRKHPQDGVMYGAKQQRVVVYDNA